jgi:hypothetical protein
MTNILLAHHGNGRSETLVWIVLTLIAIIYTFQGYRVAKLFNGTFWMVSCNISVYTILFMTANQVLLLIVYHFYGCPGNFFVMVKICIYSYTCGSDFLSNSEAYKQMAREKMFEVFLYTKSFVRNQHLDRPTARHQFLIPIFTRTNNQQQQQRAT